MSEKKNLLIMKAICNQKHDRMANMAVGTYRERPHNGERAPRGLQRLVGADGLRVLAFLGVTAFHIRPDIVPGGFLGVVIFFVLAGYFTTRSMVVRRDNPLGEYYWKKVTRLWPPLLFMLALLALFTGFVLPEVFVYLKESATSAATGWHNIAEVLADKSYFNRHGNFDPLTHLWALSLEMQFYLVFPVLYMILDVLGDYFPGKTRAWSREIAGIFLLLLGLASGYLMYLAYRPGTDPTPVYYHSFTRAGSFLIGAAAMLIQAGRQMRLASQRKLKPPFSPIFKALVCWPVLIVLIASFFYFDFQSDFLYLGGFTLYSFLTVLFLYLGGGQPVPGMRLLMDNPVSNWFASRSYGLYLWQFATMILVEAALRFSKLGFWPRLGIQLAAFLILAEISWQLFENRKNGIRRGMRNALGVFLAGILTVMMVLPAPVKPKAPRLEGDAVLQAIEKNREIQGSLAKHSEEVSISMASAEVTSTGTEPDTTESGEAETGESESEETELPTIPADELIGTGNPYGFTEDEITKLANLRMVLIGDSVLAMAMDGIYHYNPNAYIDAEVSRHFIAGPSILQGLDAAGIPSDVVVIALSTNGDIYEETMDIYLQVAAGRPLIFVNTVVPNTWEQPNNQRLADYAATHSGVYIADWYAAAKNNPEYFYQDATHPVPAGADVYDQIILRTILNAVP